MKIHRCLSVVKVWRLMFSYGYGCCCCSCCCCCSFNKLKMREFFAAIALFFYFSLVLFFFASFISLRRFIIADFDIYCKYPKNNVFFRTKNERNTLPFYYSTKLSLCFQRNSWARILLFFNFLFPSSSDSNFKCF